MTLFVVAIASGMRIGDRYILLDKLGAGGMGVVFRARDEQLNCEVAVKLLHTSASSAEAKRRLRREARAASALDPKRVAQVFEVGETADGDLYLVMEYVSGTTVRERMRSGGITRAEALHIVRELALVLGEAHRAGLVHRDVKPENVLVREDGRVVLLDFGVVKQVQSSDAAHLSTQLTSAGTVIGTPAYLAPEQALGTGAGPEIDQFALAVVTFELFTGKIPWTASDMTQLLAQVLEARPPAASSFNETLPREIDAVLWRALSKSPHARFATVEAFADALDAAARGVAMADVSTRTLAVSDALHPTPPLPALVSVRVTKGGRRRWMLGSALAAVVAAGVAATVVARVGVRRVPSTSAATAPPFPLAAPGAIVACPIFEARGVGEVANWIGAAASSLVCARARWHVGGRDDRALAPAVLLDVPSEIVDVLPDPYSAPDRRQRSVEAARARAVAYIDGIVTRENEAWSLALTLRAGDDREIAKAEGAGEPLGLAVKNAVAALWRAAAFAGQPMDAEVVKWLGIPDVEVGTVWTDLDHLRTPPEGCPRIYAREQELGAVGPFLARQCDHALGKKPRAPPLDESSPAALAMSMRNFQEHDRPLPDAAALGARLDELRASEPSRFGRARLAFGATIAWAYAENDDRASDAALAAVREDPRDLDARSRLRDVAVRQRFSTGAVALAWFPSEPYFMTQVSEIRTDALELRVRNTHLAYLLDPQPDRVVHWGKTLADAGRTTEARTLAALPRPDAVRSGIEGMILAQVDMHEARFLRAFERLQGVRGYAEGDAHYALAPLARLLGRSAEAGDVAAEQFLAKNDDQLGSHLGNDLGLIALCMEARKDRALRCLDRWEKAGGVGLDFWGESRKRLVEGARRYAQGDIRGAAAAWRPITGADIKIGCLVPTDVFERAGEIDMAARLDAAKMTVAVFGGVSEAAPREAKRALARGDRARARELANKIVQAWGVADTVVPAVADMRAILAAGR